MNDERWTQVDEYIERHLLAADHGLQVAAFSSAKAGLPPIAVSPPQGKLLMLLAKIQGARRVLEIGTLGGYSAIWMARALPSGGKLVTLESDAKHAAIASASIAAAGLGDRIDIRVGPALETLPKLLAEGKDPFDLTFIDADKPNNTAYFEWALRLSRPGSLIVVDNVVRGGAVVGGASADENARGAQSLFERLASEKRVTATAIQTVGSKGYDGFVLALVERV
jgi:predicted O-methyltransferase YrrM